MKTGPILLTLSAPIPLILTRPTTRHLMPQISCRKRWCWWFRDQNQPPLQTIRYQLNNDSLERIVNGNVQVLARNVDMNTANSFFDYDLNSEGRVAIVDIKLTGKTRALKDDAVSGEKTRSVDDVGEVEERILDPSSGDEGRS